MCQRLLDEPADLAAHAALVRVSFDAQCVAEFGRQADGQDGVGPVGGLLGSGHEQDSSCLYSVCQVLSSK